MYTNNSTGATQQKVLLLSLGQLIKSDMAKTIYAFAEHVANRSWLNQYNLGFVVYCYKVTTTYLDYALYCLGVQNTMFGVIDGYKQGGYLLEGEERTPGEDGFTAEDKRFIDAINRHLGVNISNADFKVVWNKMCEVSDQSVAEIREILELLGTASAKMGIISETNAMQVRYIQEQLAQKGVDLAQARNITLVTSFQEKVADRNTLATNFAAEYDTEGNKIISLHRDIKPHLNNAAFSYVKVTNQDSIAAKVQEALSSPTEQLAETTFAGNELVRRGQRVTEAQTL